MKFCSLLLIISISHSVLSQNLGHGYEFENNGKKKGNPEFKSIYQKNRPEFQPIALSSTDLLAFNNSKKYLTKNATTSHQYGNLDITNQQLIQVIELLQTKELDTLHTLKPFELFQIQGEDKQGNVHFTGYFVPVVEVRQKADSVFRFPLYKKPSLAPDQMPTRAQIDFEDALKDQELELAYSSSLLDNNFMQVQGSGVVQYKDGSTRLLSYGGKNYHPYVSIGKHLVETGQIPAEKISLEAIRIYFDQRPDSIESILSLNPSYTFFTDGSNDPIGAANVPLTSQVSVAVDTKFIPLGAVLLAKVPVLNEKGILVDHKYQFITAQDRGGAIKGSGHIDFYFGVGQMAERKANAMHHYGEVWLLLPND